MRASAYDVGTGALGSALALATLISCESPTSILPSGAVPFSPPPKYRLWWSMVEACSGHTRDFNAVSWYVLPGALVLPNGAVGSYYRSTSQIVLAELPSLVPPFVRHEMLHAILPTGGHPRDSFLDSCGDIVSCDDAHCALDAGGRTTPADTSREIQPAEVGTRFEITPEAPSETAYGGAWAITVSVTNPHPFHVWVLLTPEPQGPLFKTFGVVLDAGDSTQGGGPWTATTKARFGLAPNETRRWVSEHVAHAGPQGVRAYCSSDTTSRAFFNVQK